MACLCEQKCGVNERFEALGADIVAKLIRARSISGASLAELRRAAVGSVFLVKESMSRRAGGGA